MLDDLHENGHAQKMDIVCGSVDQLVSIIICASHLFYMYKISRTILRY